MEWFKLILLVGRMVDFLVKKRQLLDEIRWRHYDMAPCRHQLELMEARQNMAKSMAGFLEKSAMLFAMFFNLGITTLSNIATKLSFSVWGGQQRSV